MRTTRRGLQDFQSCDALQLGFSIRGLKTLTRFEGLGLCVFHEDMDRLPQACLRPAALSSKSCTFRLQSLFHMSGLIRCNQQSFKFTHSLVVWGLFPRCCSRLLRGATLFWTQAFSAR